MKKILLINRRQFYEDSDNSNKQYYRYIIIETELFEGKKKKVFVSAQRIAWHVF